MSAAQAIAAVDKLTRQVQDLEDRINRSIRLQESDATSFDMKLPGLDGRKSAYPYFGTDGALSLVNSVASDNTVVSTFMETVVDDATGLAALTTMGGMPVYNVVTYGADPTGSADSTTAIQTAIDAASAAGGGTVFFPQGTYSISSTLTTYSSIRLLGDGDNGSAKLRLAVNSDCNLIESTTQWNINMLIENLWLEGDKDNQASGHGIYMSEALHTKIRNCVIRNFKETGVYLTACNDVRVRECFIYKNYRGYYSTESENCNIVDSIVSQSDTVQIEKHSTLTSAAMYRHVGSIRGTWCENDVLNQTPTDHIIIDADGVNIMSCTFSGAGVTNSMINLKTGAMGNTIMGNTFLQPTAGGISILLDSGAQRNVCLNNGGNVSPITTDNDGRNYILEARLSPFFAWLEQRGRVFTLPITFGAADATPTVRDGNVFLTGGAVTFTDFDDGVEGQSIIILAAHAVTVTDGTNIFLNGSTNFVMASGDTLMLYCHSDGKWYELGRHYGIWPSLVSGADGATQGTLTLWDGAGGNTPGYILLYSPNGTANYFFAEDDGTLKRHTSAPTQNSDGTAVGDQTD
jgi:hypothetical protein